MDKKTKQPLPKAEKEPNVTAAACAYFKLLIMNVAGPSDGEGSADRRKQTIHDVIEIEHPNLILFQEFGWKGVSGRTWSKFPIDDRYQLSGNTEASLLYDSNEFLISELPAKTLQSVLDEMKRKDGEVPTDFTPLPRMCARIVESKGVPIKTIICVSWHGRYSKHSVSELIQEFKNTMKFFKALLSKLKGDLSMIIGGDFNINIKKIKEFVISPFQIYEYSPAKRRSGNIIDFYITTTNQVLKDVQVLDISKISEAKNPLKVLDHDPVKALLY